jgi:hypothetical protein
VSFAKSDLGVKELNMKTITTILAIILLFGGMAYAQECGPSCPVCTGAGSSEGALLSRNAVIASVISIPDAEEERAVFNIRYGFLDWVDAGVGYAARTEKMLWNLRVQPIPEKKGNWQPALILGTGSVQIGGSDQSLYAQLIKSWDIDKTFSLSLSAGTATLLPDFDEVYGLAGITGNILDRFSVFANYDGISYHEGVSWIVLDWLTASFLMVESESPAVSVSFKW